jgi:hypothetical protein
MIDLDAKVRSLVENGVSRRGIMRELDTIATAAERRAKRFSRGQEPSGIERRTRGRLWKGSDGFFSTYVMAHRRSTSVAGTHIARRGGVTLCLERQVGRCCY